MYQEAVTHYLASGGKLMVLFGVLIRDTAPTDKDLQSRSAALARSIDAPTTAVLQAWYLPEPIDRWPRLAMGASP